MTVESVIENFFSSSANAEQPKVTIERHSTTVAAVGWSLLNDDVAW
jgi:hypothetical protein